MKSENTKHKSLRKNSLLLGYKTPPKYEAKNRKFENIFEVMKILDIDGVFPIENLKLKYVFGMGDHIFEKSFNQKFFDQTSSIIREDWLPFF